MPTRWFSKIPFCAVVLSLAMMLFGGSSQPLQAQTSDSLPDLDVVLVIDESGSMWLTNDPEVIEGSRNDRPGWRIVVAKLFADLLGVDQSGSDHRLAVVVYGTDGKLVKPLSSMQDEVVRTEFKQAIDDAHENMRWTDIPEALELAQQELDSHGRTGPNVKQAVIFLTDGKYEIHENMTAEETRQAHAQIIERIETRIAGRYRVYTLGPAKTSFETESDYVDNKSLLEEIGLTTGGQYFELEKAEDELLDVYITILRDLFDLPPTKVTPAHSPTEVRFTIPPGLLQIILTVVKYNRDIVTTIIRPDGRQVENTDTGVEYAISPQTDSYSLLMPEPGEWTVQLTGDGRATFVAIPLTKNRYIVDRLIPGPIHPQGKPMDLVVRVVDDDQKSQQATSLDVTVQLPDGSSWSFVLQPEEDRYHARLDDTVQEGNYQLTFRGTNNNTPFESEQTIRVMKLPWIDVLEPVPDRQYPSNMPLPVRGQLMFGTKSLAQPNTAYRLEAEARAIKANDESVDTSQLRLAPDGQFSGTLQVDDEGLYRVQARLKLTKPTGEKFEDISEVLATIRAQTSRMAEPPTAWKQLVDWFGPDGWVSLGLVGLLIGLWVFRRTIVAWFFRPSGTPTAPMSASPLETTPVEIVATEPSIASATIELKPVTAATLGPVFKPVEAPLGLTHNPYIVGPPIDDASLFFGRQDVFGYVRRELESTRGNLALVLYGGRRTGKTSTLLQIRNGRLGPAYAPVYIDMQVMAEATARDFFTRITQAIADVLNDPTLRAAVEHLSHEEGNTYRVFERVLDLAYGVAADRRLLLTFDEYEILDRMVESGRISPDIFPYLKSIMEQPRRLALLFTGSRPLEEMRSQHWDWARTFAPAQYKRISFLATDEARRLIIEPVQPGITYEASAVEAILRVGAGHPYFTQGICGAVVDLILYENRRVVKLSDVDEAIRSLVDNPLPHMIFLWNEAGSSERLVLAALAAALSNMDEWLSFDQMDTVLKLHKAQLPVERMRSTLGNLVRRDELLERHDDTYRYRIDLLRHWIRDEHSLWQTMAEQATTP